MSVIPPHGGKVPHVFDANGNVVRLGTKLGQGGEGAVYQIDSHDRLVAKIYHAPLSKERAAKILAMMKLRTDELSSLTAWPLGLLSEKCSGGPIGIVVPKIIGRKDIHHLYSPKSRRSEFQRADWRFLIRAAANTARAFAVVHEAGCIIGDVNHGGVLVAQDATVRLIDCDSFQVTSAGRRFLCTVGVETFTPPELQGKPFASILRTENHDNFGLAVLTFLLLFMGRHPFAGIFSGHGDMPIAKAIEEVRFAYGSKRAHVGMQPPPGTPPLSIVGPTLSLMFERAFARETTAGGRPGAREWSAALGELEKELTQCSANPAHWHHRGSSCPWCPMEGATGVSLFPLVMQTGSAAAFGFDRLWQQIEAIPNPGPAPVIAASSTISASDKAKALAGYWKKNAAAGATALAAAAVLLLMGLAGSGFIFLLLGIGAFFLIRALMNNSEKIEALRRTRDAAQATWSKVESEWGAKAGPDRFVAVKERLRETRRDWNNIPNLRVRKLEVLRKNQEALQRERFLDSFEIEKAKIGGIGSGRKQILRSFGIETATDITLQAIASVPGFGPVRQEKLLRWRREIERRFVFDAKKAIDARDITKVEQEVLAERMRIEAVLKQGFLELRQIQAMIAATRQHMRAQVEGARNAFLQACADYDAASK